MQNFDIENTKIVTYPKVIFNNEYRIDKDGDVWTPYRGWHQLSKQKIAKGYLRVGMMTSEGRRFFMIHRLVLEAYNPIENSLEFQVNHIDGDKENNKLENLEWCTQSQNMRHSLDTGLKIPKKGTEIRTSKLTEEDVLLICDYLKNSNFSLQEIGDKFGVSKHCIFDIKRKKSWSWLTKDYTF